jgi:hypothetical protein
VGLVLGLTLDTTGPRTAPVEAAAGEPEAETAVRDVEPADRPVATGEGGTPQPDASPRSGAPPREE